MAQLAGNLCTGTTDAYASSQGYLQSRTGSVTSLDNFQTSGGGGGGGTKSGAWNPAGTRKNP